MIGFGNKLNYMKELKINVPDGYEIDKDKSTFENIVFKKKVILPKSWDDMGSVDGFAVNGQDVVGSRMLYLKSTNTNLFKTMEQAEAAIALAKLSQLRDVYREGWDPDWASRSEKYCITFNDHNPVIEMSFIDHRFLSFPHARTAKTFLENFSEIIEQAKPLMS